MKTRKPTLSPAQIAYATAKALVETLRAEFDAECTRAGLQHREDMSDEEAARLWAALEALDERLGFPQAAKALRAAEKALIAWAASIVKRRGGYALVAPLFDKPVADRRIHQELVDLCFRLAA